MGMLYLRLSMIVPEIELQKMVSQTAFFYMKMTF